MYRYAIESDFSMVNKYVCCHKLMQVKSILDEFLEKLPEEFNMMELFARAEEKTPYVLVALQECERMNGLTREMKRSLKEVDLGLKVHKIQFLCYLINGKFGDVY